MRVTKKILTRAAAKYFFFFNFPGDNTKNPSMIDVSLFKKVQYEIEVESIFLLALFVQEKWGRLHSCAVSASPEPQTGVYLTSFLF